MHGGVNGPQHCRSIPSLAVLLLTFRFLVIAFFSPLKRIIPKNLFTGGNDMNLING